MAMNLNNLKIFAAVAESENVTRAAERLYISQPAVSKAIQTLEEDLGVQLFSRDKRIGMRLTETGEHILRDARQMLQLEERIRQTAYLSRNLLEGTLKIASLPSGTERFLIHALAGFQQTYPGVQVEILEGSTGEVKAMIQENRAEFGISIVDSGAFQQRLLLEDRIVAFSREPLDQETVVLPDDRLPFVLCKAALEAIQNELGYDPTTKDRNFRVSSPSAVRLTAREGLGVGLQSAMLAEVLRPELHFYQVEPEIRTDLVLIANDFEALSPAAQAFLAVLPTHRNQA